MKKAVFHLGPHKTGTTALQLLLKANESWLAEHNALFISQHSSLHRGYLDWRARFVMARDLGKDASLVELFDELFDIYGLSRKTSAILYSDENLIGKPIGHFASSRCVARVNEYYPLAFTVIEAAKTALFKRGFSPQFVLTQRSWRNLKESIFKDYFMKYYPGRASSKAKFYEYLKSVSAKKSYDEFWLKCKLFEGVTIVDYAENASASILKLFARALDEVGIQDASPFIARQIPLSANISPSMATIHFLERSKEFFWPDQSQRALVYPSRLSYLKIEEALVSCIKDLAEEEKQKHVEPQISARLADSGASEDSIRVMQYYSPPPEDLVGPELIPNTIRSVNRMLRSKWNSALAGLGSYDLITRDQAAVLISQWHGEEFMESFLKCRLPAMQSDFFRVAFLAYHHHALYIDWPFYLRTDCYSLLQRISLHNESLVLGVKNLRNGSWRLWNGFALRSGEKAGKKFFGELLERIHCNIKEKVSNNVWEVTGPGAWILTYQECRPPSHSVVSMPDDLSRLFKLAFDKRSDMSQHWSNLQKTSSIYFELND